MKVEYINPFILAAKNAFGTMLGCELERSDLFASRDTQPTNDVTGIIGLTGKAKGCVALSMSRELALRATETMAMSQPNGIDEEVVDVVGELANMVAGGAKAQLEAYEMRISLPTVIVGRTAAIQFPSETPSLCICFTSEWGPLTVQVGLVEESVAAAV